jgi:hypothetical protein
MSVSLWSVGPIASIAALSVPTNSRNTGRASGQCRAELAYCARWQAEGVPNMQAMQPSAIARSLTAAEIRALTLFKWRYSIETAGFSRREAEHLLFLRWLYATRRDNR